jgi:hypothetical protein
MWLVYISLSTDDLLQSQLKILLFSIQQSASLFNMATIVANSCIWTALILVWGHMGQGLPSELKETP